MDMISDGVAWLADRREEFLSQEAVYSRGTASVTLNVTCGSTVYSMQDENGMLIKAKSTDFIFTAAELILGSTTTLPVIGDKIDLDDGRRFEILDLGGTGCYRPANPFGTTLRIHTKEVHI